MGSSLDQEIARQLAAAPPTDDLDAEIARQLDAERRKHGIYQGAAAPPEPSPIQQGLKAAGEAFDQQFPGVRKVGAATIAHPLATAANVAAGVPGVEAAEAGARALVRHQSYPEALGDIRGAEKELPKSVRIGGRMAGGALAGGAASALPVVGPLLSKLSPTMQGIAWGGVQGATEADPVSLTKRAEQTVADALMGGVVGKVVSSVATGMRVKNAPNFDENKLTRMAARSEAAEPAYTAFRDLGDLGSTPKLDAILQLPVVRRAVETVQGESPLLSQLPATDARVLDAVYKRVGDKAFTMAHGVETGEARTALADAIEEAARRKGGSYADALAAYRTPSKEIEALDLGRTTFRNAMKPGGTAPKRIGTESPTAVLERAPSMSPEERTALTEGILGQAQRNPLLARLGFARVHLPVPAPSRSLSTTADLLSKLEGNQKTSAPISAFLAALLGGR